MNQFLGLYSWLRNWAAVAIGGLLLPIGLVLLLARYLGAMDIVSEMPSGADAARAGLVDEEAEFRRLGDHCYERSKHHVQESLARIDIYPDDRSLEFNQKNWQAKPRDADGQHEFVYQVWQKGQHTGQVNGSFDTATCYITEIVVSLISNQQQ